MSHGLQACECFWPLAASIVRSLVSESEYSETGQAMPQMLWCLCDTTRAGQHYLSSIN